MNKEKVYDIVCIRTSLMLILISMNAQLLQERYTKSVNPPRALHSFPASESRIKFREIIFLWANILIRAFTSRFSLFLCHFVILSGIVKPWERLYGLRIMWCGPRKNIPFPISWDYTILLQFYVALTRSRLVKLSRMYIFSSSFSAKAIIPCIHFLMDAYSLGGK